MREICDGFVNISDKALCYCLFFGIYGEKGDDLKNLTAECIDLNTGHIVLRNGKEVNVPTWAAQAMYDSCEEYTYYVYKQNGEIFEAGLREDDPTVFKARNNATRDGQKQFLQRVTRRIVKIREDTDNIAFSIRRLKTSGMIWAMKEYAKEKNLDTFQLFKAPYTVEIFKRYGITFYPVSFEDFKKKYLMYLE